MANVLVEETSLQNIANSIREKTGTEDTYKPSEMASAISNITTKEDLSTELTAQDTLIDTQEDSINDIIEALNGKAGVTGGAAGDVWVDGNELHINVKKYRENDEFFNSNFSFPTTFYFEDITEYETISELTVEETDEIVFDLTDYINVELLNIRQSRGMITIGVKRTNDVFIISDTGFDVGQYNG